jgi:MSHA biogenesis protein MshK
MKYRDIKLLSELSIKGVRIAALYAACFSLVQLSMTAAADELNDPTRPPLLSHPVAKAAPVAVQRLTAVLFSEDRRVAVIDGHVLREGDRVGNAIIKQITNDSVTLNRTGRTEVMRLPKSTLQIKSSSAVESRP